MVGNPASRDTMTTVSEQLPPRVRPAGSADLTWIGAIQARAWRRNYATVLPADVLAALDPASLAEQWRPAVLTSPSSAHIVFVALADDLVLGFTALDGDGEIVALEVDPLHQRQGHGSRLVAALADHGREQSLAALSVWCPLADEARRTFFVSAGFGPSGGVRDLTDASGRTVREAQLVAALDDEPGDHPDASRETT